MRKKLFAILLSLCMVVTMMPGLALAQSGNSVPQGLSVEYNGGYLTGDLGDSAIEIMEGSGISLQIYYNGVAVTAENVGDKHPFAEEDPEKGVCNPGVSPDGALLEISLPDSASGGDDSTVELAYMGQIIKLKVKVVEGIRLQVTGSGDSPKTGTIKRGGTIKGYGESAIISKITYMGEDITSSCEVWSGSTAVCSAVTDGTSKVTTLTSKGNGESTIGVNYKLSRSDTINAEFTWVSPDMTSKDSATNVSIASGGVTYLPGDTLSAVKGSAITGTITAPGGYSEEVQADPGKTPPTADVDNGNLTIDTRDVNAGWYTIKITGNNNSWVAEFRLQVRGSNPSKYVLQTYSMNQQDDGTWIARGGMGTIAIFKNPEVVHYFKFVVTDEKMERVDYSHFVDVDTDNIKVMRWQSNEEGDGGSYVDVGGNNPFSFEMVGDNNDILQVTYDRDKDVYGPEYQLVYTDADDKYLSSADEDKVNKSILLWTRSYTQSLTWNNVGGSGDNWWYDAVVTKTDEESGETIKDTQVTIPDEIFATDEEKDNKINIVEDSSTLEIRTNNADVCFDDKVMSQIDDAEGDVTLDVKKIEYGDTEYTEASTALADAEAIVDLSLTVEADTSDTEAANTSDPQAANISNPETADTSETISQLDGTATITLDYELKDESKVPEVYYVYSDENGTVKKEAVDAEYDGSELTFTTDHFSMFSVEEGDNSNSNTTVVTPMYEAWSNEGDIALDEGKISVSDFNDNNAYSRQDEIEINYGTGYHIQYFCYEDNDDLVFLNADNVSNLPVDKANHLTFIKCSEDECEGEGNCPGWEVLIKEGTQVGANGVITYTKDDKTYSIKYTIALPNIGIYEESVGRPENLMSRIEAWNDSENAPRQVVATTFSYDELSVDENKDGTKTIYFVADFWDGVNVSNMELKNGYDEEKDGWIDFESEYITDSIFHPSGNGNPAYLEVKVSKDIDSKDFFVLATYTAGEDEEVYTFEQFFCIFGGDEQYDEIESDELVVCVATNAKDTYEALPTTQNDYGGAQSPAHFYLSEHSNKTFYVLVDTESELNNKGDLTLQKLNYYRNPTGEQETNVTISKVTETVDNVITPITVTKTVTNTNNNTNNKDTKDIYSKAEASDDQKSYYVWKVVVGNDFTGESRVGFKFGEASVSGSNQWNGQDNVGDDFARYSKSDSNMGYWAKFMWILDKDYSNTMDDLDQGENIYVCETLPSGPYSDKGSLLNDTGLNNDMVKSINISKSLTDDDNAIYIVHEKGTTVSDTSYVEYSYDQQGSGFGRGGAQGGWFQKAISGPAYDYVQNAGTVKVNGTEMTVDRATLKAQNGHQKLRTKFYVTDNANGDCAKIAIQKGMDVTLTGDVSGGIASINTVADEVAKAVDNFDSAQLSFSDNGDGTYSSYLDTAAACISDEGMGRFIEFAIELEPGYVIEKVTDKDGKLLGFTSSRWFLYSPIVNNSVTYSATDIQELGWSSGIAGSNGKNGNRSVINTLHCVATCEPEYMTNLKGQQTYSNLGTGNISAFVDFVTGTGEYKNNGAKEVKLQNTYTNYTVYFNPADDDNLNEIVIHVKKAESADSGITARENGADTNKIYATIASVDPDTEAALRENLNALGYSDYNILKTYDITNTSTSNGIYNISISESELDGVSPETCKVIYYDDNGVPVEMETTVTTGADGNANGIAFTTGHFSKYAILSTETPNTDPTPTPSGGGSAGGAAVTTDNVTNTAENKTTETPATTTATVKAETKTDSTGAKTTTATVDSTTASKIVTKAVENKSEEVVVDTTTKAAVTETAAGAKTEVSIPAETISQISEKTDAEVVIKTDAAEVVLDEKTVEAVAEQAGTTGDVKLVVETVSQDDSKLEVELKLVSSNGNVSDFNGGNVSVTVKLGKALAAKKLICVYIDDNGTYHKVSGQLNADGTYTFTTTHFSRYAIMAKEDVDKIIAEQIANVEKMVGKLSLKARSSKTSKGNIKVKLITDSSDIKDLENLGYTVKYKFYRSTKKSSGYSAKIEKDSKTYTNTTGKKGTRYYYKARVMVYDAQGNLIAKSALKQCKFATRIK